MVWGGKDWDMTAYPGTHSNWGYIFAWDRAVLGIGLESKLGSRVEQSKQKWKEIVCKGKSFGWVWQLFLLANVREYLSNSSWTMTHITIIKPRKRLRPAWEFFLKCSVWRPPKTYPPNLFGPLESILCGICEMLVYRQAPGIQSCSCENCFQSI